MTTVLYAQSELTCGSARADGDDLWLSPTDLEAATGWFMKPEGLCKDSVCVPIPPARAERFARDGMINVAEAWRHLGQPVAHDRAGDVWVLGASASEQAAKLQSLEAPDFALPDLAGKMTALSDHLGKRVMLVSWASW